MSETEIIDAHVHVWSANSGRFPFAAGFGPDDLWWPSFDETDLVDRAKPSGVGRFNLVQMTWYGLDHTYVLDLINRNPHQFAGTGIVPALGDVTLAEPDSAMEALADQGIRSFRIRGRSTRPIISDGSRWLDHRAFDAMFATAARRNLPLSFLCGAEDLAEIDRMCARHGDAPVIIDHLALLAPATEPTHDGLVALCGLARHSRTMVKVGAFGALSRSGAPYLDMLPIVQRVIDAFGPERCMWASDSPRHTVPPHSYDTSVGLLRRAGLSKGDLEQLLCATAKSVFWPE